MGWLSDHVPDYNEERQGAVEDRAIRRLLNYANAMSVREAKLQCQQATGKNYLNFHWFNDYFGRFPVQLGVAKIPWIHNAKVHDLFDNFTKLRCFQEYQKFAEQIQENPAVTRIGLIFPWPKIKQGGSAMVLHNYPTQSWVTDPDLREERGTRIVRPFGNPLVVYVIESLNDFMMSIGTDWAGA